MKQRLQMDLSFCYTHLTYVLFHTHTLQTYYKLLNRRTRLKYHEIQEI